MTLRMYPPKKYPAKNTGYLLHNNAENISDLRHVLEASLNCTVNISPVRTILSYEPRCISSPLRLVRRSSADEPERK
jgi:hypothetical protein